MDPILHCQCSLNAWLVISTTTKNFYPENTTAFQTPNIIVQCNIMYKLFQIYY